MSNTPIISFGDFYTIAWNMVPSVWREADDSYGKSLQITLYTICQHMYYYFYNRAAYMDELFDPDLCPEKYLRFLAGMVGWTLQGTDVISWREQIKAAPLLYKLKGTKRGLLLAEKLVGYSVFMSELYRDHIGDIVSKEKIFNNTPSNIVKPWFRKALLDLNGNSLPGIVESDQFDSYNATNLVKLDKFGNVIRPKIVTNKRTVAFSLSSTTSRYQLLSGKYSLARYAKLPRMNIVLNYDYDLDTENSDGSVKNNNFSGALDLLLQFTPFHVYIENLEVRYDLSEFIFDETLIDSDLFSTAENINFIIDIDSSTSRSEDTIAYGPGTPGTSLEGSPKSTIDNRGVMSSVYSVVDFSVITPTLVNDFNSLLTKSFPVKSFVQNSTTLQVLPAILGDKIYTAADITISITVPCNFYRQSAYFFGSLEYSSWIDRLDSGSFVSDGILPGMTITLTGTKYNNISFVVNSVNTQTLNLVTTKISGVWYGLVVPEIAYFTTITFPQMPYTPNINTYIVNGSYLYNPGHTIVKYQTPTLAGMCDFKAMLSSQQGVYDSAETTTTPDSNGYAKILVPTSYMSGLDSSSITGINIVSQSYRSSVSTTYDTQELVLPTQTSTTISRPWDLQNLQVFSTAVSSVALSNLDIFKTIYNDTLCCVLQVNTTYILLTKGIDYYFDNSSVIYLNSSSIASKLNPVPTDYTYLLTSKLHICYLTRTTYTDDTELGIPVRGFRYTNRVNTKFSRQFAVNSLPSPSEQTLGPTTLVSLDAKTKQETVLGIKKFKTLSTIYTRSSLKSQKIDNYTVVSRDPLNRLDQSKWTVYSPEYSSYYLGDQSITNNWWGNYYEAKFTTAQVPYTSVDTSEAGQINHYKSDQWASALKTYNPSDPTEFLVTRTVNENRQSIWNRSSCKFMSVPFIRSRRDNLQVFRSDTPTFTRTEESTDYLTNIGSPSRIDNIKYVLTDGTDVSLSYFSPGFSSSLPVVPSTDFINGQKAVISGYNLSTQTTETTYYNSSFYGLSPNLYFVQQNTGDFIIKPSLLYAGNILVSLDPTINQGMSEASDVLNISIPGLTNEQDIFTVSSPVTYSFSLSHSNVWVTWSNLNTGDVVGYGYYSSFLTSSIAPNINVFVNGMLMPYYTNWILPQDSLTPIITILTSLEANDVVSIEYQISASIPLVATAPPLPQNPQTLNYTVVISDITNIALGNRFFYALPAQGTNIPCVSWYSSATYVNSSSTPTGYQPSGYFDTATPNVTVILNGTTLVYKKDWLFLLTEVSGIITASIVLSVSLSNSLTSGSILQVNYFSTT